MCGRKKPVDVVDQASGNYYYRLSAESSEERSAGEVRESPSMNRVMTVQY